MAIQLPAVSGDNGTWGTKLNSNFTEIDARVPAVNSSQNGYVLTVVSGNWAVVAPSTPTPFIISATEPAGAADGTVWIQP